MEKELKLPRMAGQAVSTFVSHLECSYTGTRYAAGTVHTVSAAGKPLLVRYDLAALRAVVSKDLISTRAGGLWRFHEFLPVANVGNRLDLGETVTPLVQLRAEARGEVWVKDEG